MADEIRQTEHYTTIADKPGEAARILSELHKAGINLLGFSGFPQGNRKSQLDFLPEDSAAFKKAAKKSGLKLSKRMSVFLVQGQDRPGALAEALLEKLAQAGINVTAVRRSAQAQADTGTAAGSPPDVRKAAESLASRLGHGPVRIELTKFEDHFRKRPPLTL
jgi:prephenate dehydratase